MLKLEGQSFHSVSYFTTVFENHLKYLIFATQILNLYKNDKNDFKYSTRFARNVLNVRHFK